MSNILFLIIGGILLAYTFPPYNFSIFLYFSFIPFFLWLKEREGILKRIGGAFLFYFSFAIFISFPIYSLIETSFFQYLTYPYLIDISLSILVYLILIFLYSIPYLIYALGIPYFLKKGLEGIFLLSFEFAILEYIFSSFFPNPFVLGYAVNIGWFSNLFSRSFGTSGLTFFIVFSNLFILYLFLEKKNSKWFPYLFFGFLIFLIYVSFGSILPNRNSQRYSIKDKKTINLLLVQKAIDFKRPDFFKELEELIEYSNGFKTYHPDLVVWPESAVPIRISKYPHIEKLIKKLPKKLGTYLVFGTYGESKDNGKYNQAIVFAPDGKTLKTYSKIKIIPFFEGPPNKTFLERKNYPFKDRNFIQGKNFKLFAIKNKTFGLLICSEVLFPSMVRRLKREGMDILIVISNEASLPKMYSLLLLNIAKYRAQENGIFIVRVNTTGYSALISPMGKVVKMLPYGKKGILKVSIPIYSYQDTFYSKYGITPIVLGFFFLVFRMLLRNIL